MLNKYKVGFIILHALSSQLYTKIQMKIMQRIKNVRNYTEMLTVLSFIMEKKWFFYFFLKNPPVTSEYLYGGQGEGCAHCIL